MANNTNEDPNKYNIGVRRVDQYDLDQVIELIRESTNKTTLVTKQDLQVDLFSYQPRKRFGDRNVQPSNDNNLYDSNRSIAQMLVAVRYPDDLLNHKDSGSNDQLVVGYVLFHNGYTPWIGSCTMIDDIYVRSEYRRKGVAKKLMVELERLSKLDEVNAFVGNADKKRLSNWDEIVKLMEGLNFSVARNEETDYSVFKMYL